MFDRNAGGEVAPGRSPAVRRRGGLRGVDLHGIDVPSRPEQP